MFTIEQLSNCIQIQRARIILALYVQPNAKHTEFEKIHDNQLKLKVKAPPEDGRANQEITQYLARFFRIKKNQISILSGELSRHKRIEILLEKEYTLEEFSRYFTRTRA
ncbi:MAG: YggU family protein [Bdellovibrionaceae bacterium]|nr:YggU family protein [Pseudobdellovibrionaceae bacterium]